MLAPSYTKSLVPYDFPRAPDIEKPTHAQKQMVRFAVLNPRSFNLSDMGTMKTLATLWAADWLMRQSPCRALIVAPLSTIEDVWGDSIFKHFFGRRTYKILHGSAAFRGKALATPADFYIINYEGLGVGAKKRGKLILDGFSKLLSERLDIKLVVIDEASAYKDSRTTRHKVASALFAHKPYLWMLSGTPTPNDPTDAYGLARLMGTTKGESYTSFHHRTMMQVSQFKWIPRFGGYEAARALLQPAIRFDIKDVWDGPPMTTQQRHVELTPAQQKALREIKHGFVAKLQSGAQIVAFNEAAVRTKALQISLGAVYDSVHKDHLIDARPRARAVLEVVEQSQGKILLFTPFTSSIQLLYKVLKDLYPTALVYGDVTQKERHEIFSRFQDESNPLRIIVADPGTMSHGLNLYAARVVIWYGPTDKSELYQQACKRAHRPGQRYPVTVVQLVSNKLEKEIFERLEHKQSLQGVMLKAVRENWI